MNRDSGATADRPRQRTGDEDRRSAERVCRRLQPGDPRDRVEVVVEGVQLLDPRSFHIRDDGRVAEGDPLVRLEEFDRAVEVRLCGADEFEARRRREPATEVDRDVVALALVDPVQRLQQHVVRDPGGREIAAIDGVDDGLRPFVAVVGARIFVVDEDVGVENGDRRSGVLCERGVLLVPGEVVCFEPVPA